MPCSNKAHRAALTLVSMAKPAHLLRKKMEREMRPLWKRLHVETRERGALPQNLSNGPLNGAACACGGLSQLYLQCLWHACCLQAQTLGKALPLETRLKFWGNRGKLSSQETLEEKEFFIIKANILYKDWTPCIGLATPKPIQGTQKFQTHRLCSCRRNTGPRQPRGQPPQSLRRPGDAAGGGAGASTWWPAPCHDSWALAGASQGSSGLAQRLRRRAPHPSLVNQEAWSPWFNLSYLDWPGGKAVPQSPGSLGKGLLLSW